MKIAVTADIHFGTDTGEDTLNSYLKWLEDQGIDILLVAGDLASRGAEHPQFDQAVDILSRFSGRILFTPGNHDLWTKEGDSFSILREGISCRIAGSPLHLLDGSPLILDGIGFVGSVGWYDYSFSRVPPELEEYYSRYLFRCGDRVYRWRELGMEQFAGKECIVENFEGPMKRGTWMDRNFIKWDFDDEGFLNYCLKRLSGDLDEISDRCEKIIALIHHLPLPSFAPDIYHPTWGFHRAYLGSGRIGDILFSREKISHLFFGHAHRNRYELISGKHVENLFFQKPGGTRIMEIS